MKKLMLMLMLLASYVYASVGKIVAISGDAVISRGGHDIKASKTSELEKSDIITTQNNSKMQILFNDETIISVGKNSTLKISDYVFEKDNVKAEFTMGNGVFRTITGKIGKIAPENFKLKTKSASIGIRGTQIVTELDDKSEKIFCTEGKIEVTYSNPAIGSNIVTKGHYVTVIDGNVSEKLEVQTIGKDDLKQINKELLIVDNFATDDISLASNTSNVVDDSIVVDNGEAKDTSVSNDQLVATAREIQKTNSDSTQNKSTTTDGGSTDNNGGTTDGGSTDNGGGTTDGGSTDNGGGTTDDNTSGNDDSSGGTTDDNTSGNDDSSGGTTDDNTSGNDDSSGGTTDDLANLTGDDWFNSNRGTATYSGNFNSTAYNSSTQYLKNIATDNVAIPTTTTISMDVNFDATANQISNGLISINDTVNTQETALTFNGAINSDHSVTLAGTGNTVGSGDANFYGSTAGALNGTANMKDTPSSVELQGAFTTTKQ